jgi:CubicO group peptidase (beta-lactamase class C family)
MAYRWLLRCLGWASLVLAPVLVQATGPAPNAGRIATPALRGPDAAQFAALLATFETYAEQARMTWGTPGMAIAIVHQDQVIYAKGFGVKQQGGTDPVDPHTLFPIGSTSKAFTSALVALLADEGKLR